MRSSEETGLDAEASGTYLEQLRTYSAPDRHPRIKAGWQVATIAYVALAPSLPDAPEGSDAGKAAWTQIRVAAARRLAFDHAVILGDGLERVRDKLEYTSL